MVSRARSLPGAACLVLSAALCLVVPLTLSAQALKSGSGSSAAVSWIETASLPLGPAYRSPMPGGLDSTGKTPLTLGQCVELALARNPDHQIARQSLRASFGDILAAWGLYIPTVFTTYGVGKSNTSFPMEDIFSGITTRTTRFSESGYATLGMGYTVFNAGEKYFGLRNAYHLRRSLRSALKNSELEITNQVNAAYFDVLRQEKLLEASREQSAQLGEQLRRAERRHEVGEVTKLDVLQAQIDLQNQNLLVLEYENGLVNARMELDKLVGGTLGIEFQFADDFEIKQPDFDIELLVADAQEDHPQVDSLRMEIKREENNLWIGRLAYLPVLKTQLGYSFNESDITLTPDYQRGRNLAFSMNWNLLDSFNRFKTNRYNQVRVNTLKFELEKMRLELARAVRASYLELLRLYSRNLTLEESRQLAAQTLELESRRYDLGSASLIELRQARADYFQAEVDYINSIYDFQQALSELSRNAGRPLPTP